MHRKKFVSGGIEEGEHDSLLTDGGLHPGSPRSQRSQEAQHAHQPRDAQHAESLSVFGSSLASPESSAGVFRQAGDQQDSGAAAVPGGGGDGDFVYGTVSAVAPPRWDPSEQALPAA